MIEQLRDKLCAAENHDNPGTALDQAIGLYLEIASYLKALEGLQAEAKRIAGDVLTELSLTEAKTSTGRCYVTKPAVIVSYDSKGLEALADNDDELAALLTPYRRVTERAGTLTIR
jgi:hypothetical protein